MGHFLEHLGTAFEDLWDDAKRPTLNDDFKEKLIKEVSKNTQGKTAQELVKNRDSKLKAIMEILEE